MGSKNDPDNFMRLLAIIGAVLVVIVAILCFMGGLNLVRIAFGIIWLLIGIVILMSCFKPNNPVPYNEAFILIMGIVVLVLTFVISCMWIISLIAGIIIIVGGFIGMLT